MNATGAPPVLEQSAEELFEDAPCGYVVTLAGGQIVKVNATFLAWTGYAREAMLNGATFQQLLTLAGRIYYETHVAPLLEMQGYAHELAFELKRSEGAPLPVLVNCRRRDATETTPAWTCITIFDATDRRRYELELLRAHRSAEQAMRTERAAREEAECANRAKDDILALVSHELKTPLSAILGWTQVIRRKPDLPPDIGQALTVIERNTRLQSRLVDDLLDMSRVLAGKLRLDVQRLQLAAVVEAAIETVQPAALARNIRLTHVLDSDARVIGDTARLQQVFWNLLNNAVKFTPRDGAIRVSMERVNSHVDIHVVDTGQGMSATLLQHVFERFHQSDSQGTRETSGLGLGLSLVKHLVEMHGGSIRALSEGEGLGSTFIVQLPMLAVQRAETQSRARSHAVTATEGECVSVSLGGLRVMLIEDERDSREALWHALTECGAEVFGADSAQGALARIENFKPDVLISDIGLPDEDGYELIRKVRMLGGAAGRVPAVALTALSRLEDRTNALLAGFQLHLAKPIDVRELSIAVASLAARLPSPPAT